MPLGRWQPTRFVRFEQAFDTSVGTSIVVTDAGKAYLKAMGNRQSPHVLACEWVATQLADWFGLPTFDFALLMLDASDEIPLPRGLLAQAGPAFVTRAQAGYPWGGDSTALESLMNPADVSRLVVFDTWTRNCDRHSSRAGRLRVHYDNVFLSTEGLSGRQVRLMAMDHTHCFDCGRDLDAHVGDIARARDPGLYGLFDAFIPRMDRDQVGVACDQLREFTASDAGRIVESIPNQWGVAAETRQALGRFVLERAAFVADTIDDRLAPICWPPVDRELFGEEES